MTSAGESVLSAIRRADVGWLSTNLDAEACTHDVLRRLLHHDAPRLRQLGLVRLTERVTAARSDGSAAPGELAELARLLPTALAGPPEAALLQARLCLRLRPYLRPGSLPPWRTAGLPARVRIAWLCAEIADRPAAIHDEPAGELLYQAVRGIGAADVDDPAVLVRELAAGADPVLSAEALRVVREALYGALLAPARARVLVADLAATAHPEVAAAALRELAEPWAALDPFPPERLRRFLGDGDGAGDGDAVPKVADAVIEAAARHGHAGVLWELAAEPDGPPELRRRSLELLGEVTGRDDIPKLTELAAEDPLLLAVPAVACLRGLHRRGHFPDGADAPAIVGLALADHTVSAAEIATILFTCRHETFRVLVAAAPGDPAWPRRLELLVALAGQRPGDLPAGAAVTEALPSAPDPVPFLYALRALRHQAAEDAVIAALPRAPAAALDALQAVGGPRTVTALREGLGLSGPHGADPAPGAVAAHLRPVRHRALELLWQLTDDPEQRQALLPRLTPHDLPGRIAADLGAPDERELAVLSSDLDPGRPVEALCGLARNGGAAAVPVIIDLLLRVVSGLAESWEPDGPAGDRPLTGTGPPTGIGPAAEPVVPHEVVAAVRELGGRLHERGRIRPHCLLDTANAEEAGHALVADMALNLLDRPGLRPGEQAIVLGLLHQAPHPGTRARVHRLLRHRDRHVRKHAIALLTLDATGGDAQALSASLISLTTARDAPTVRQALLALGHARARWACHAIAMCLDHPDMNVKKTAAGVLAGSGTPVAVPKLLSWLGRHDNPGLRDALTGALRAILGDAHTATVLAAADRADDERTRTLLLEALSGRLSARAVGALVDQGSPAGPALLALVARGRLALGSGTVGELADRFDAHGLAAPAGPPPSHGDDPLDADVRLLADRGWAIETARRLVERHERDPAGTTADRLSGVRPMLGNWLDLAGGAGSGRGPVLRFTLRLCPMPWTAAEIETFTRSARVLTAGLTDLGGHDRDDLLAVLEQVAPRLPAAEALDLAAQVRALPPASGGVRSTLTLLRRCGATLTRADVRDALAGAHHGPDPWRAEQSVLREAFAVVERPGTESGAEPGPGPEPGEQEPAGAREADRWRTALRAAARSAGSVGRFRGDGDPVTLVPGSRDRLDALIEVFPSAHAEAREALLDWMVALQPIDAPSWTIAENAGRPAAAARTPRSGDLDQPRSAALRDRLFAMLDAADPGRRHAAADVLRHWPEPEIRLTLLRAYLRGRVDLVLTADLARALNAVDEAELHAGGAGGDDAVRERAARAAAHLDPPDVERLVHLLLSWWECGGPATRASAKRALRRVAPDLLAEELSGRLDAGAWGFLDLIAGSPLLRTPALAETRRRLVAEGRDDLVDRLVLVEGPLRHPGEAGRDAATLAALRDRPRPPSGPARTGPSREELLELARAGRPEQIRRALSRLAEPYDDRPARSGVDRDARLEDVLTELSGHSEARVRLHAHRIARKVLDRPAYLLRTTLLLDDPQPDVVRSAVKTLCHAAYEPAIPAVVGLLTHSHPIVHRAAADGLTLVGTPAVPALRHAAGRARPDRRHLYTAVLERIAATRDE